MAVLPPPAHKERQSFTGGEENVAGNLGAPAASGVAAARTKDVKREVAADQDGEALLPSK